MPLKIVFFSQLQNGLPVEDGIIACAESKHNYQGENSLDGEMRTETLF